MTPHLRSSWNLRASRHLPWAPGRKEPPIGAAWCGPAPQSRGGLCPGSSAWWGLSGEGPRLPPTYLPRSPGSPTKTVSGRADRGRGSCSVCTAIYLAYSRAYQPGARSLPRFPAFPEPSAAQPCRNLLREVDGQGLRPWEVGVSGGRVWPGGRPSPAPWAPEPAVSLHGLFTPWALGDLGEERQQ